MVNIETKHKGGRPKKEINKKQFIDLVGLGCSAEEIRWFFRDESGRSISEDTLARYCKREFGQSFAEYRKENGAVMLKIQLRRNQFALSKKSAAMAIFLGKQYLGQTDNPTAECEDKNAPIKDLLKRFDDECV